MLERKQIKRLQQTIKIIITIYYKLYFFLNIY